MSDDDPKTVPPRLSTPHVEVELRDSEADALSHAPPWIVLHVQELKLTRQQIQERENAAMDRELAEQKRADVRHDDVQRLQKEFARLEILHIDLRKVEKKLEQLREHIVGTRKDIGTITERVDMHGAQLENHQQRIEALEDQERRLVALEKHTGLQPDVISEPPVSDESG